MNYRSGSVKVLLLLLLFVFITGSTVGGADTYLEHESYIMGLTDVHIGVGDDANKALIEEILDLSRLPKFITVAGDMTEMGSYEEYANLEKIYAPLEKQVEIGWLPGNHDARWALKSFEEFEESFGPTYYYQEIGPLGIIGLNSGTYLQQHGHIGVEQLEWLEKKLKEIDEDRPLLVTAHHPLGAIADYTDDGYRVLDLLSDYNVIYILTGHLHSSEVAGVYNDTFFQSINPAMNRYYYPISWDEEYFYLWEDHPESESELLYKTPTDGIKSPGSLEWSSETAYEDGIVEIELKQEGIELIEISLGEERISITPEDEIVNIEWELDAPIYGKNLLKIEGQGNDYNYFLHEELIANTKDLKWVFDSGGSIYTDLTIEDESIYFGNQAGNFYRLEKDTGRLMWSFDSETSILSSAAIVEDKVIFGGTDGKLYALSKDLGEVEWQKDLDAIIYGGVVKGENTVAVGAGENIYGLDPENGEILWEEYAWGLIQSPGIYEDGEYYFTSWGGIIQVIDEEGELTATLTSGAGYSTPAPTVPEIYDDLLLTTNTGNRYMAHSLKDGNRIWEETGYSVGYASVESDEDYGYLSTLDGEFFSFEPETGEIIWKEKIKSPVYDSSPSLFNDKLAAGTLHGEVVILNREDGTKRSRIDLGEGYIFSKIAVTDDLLLVGSMDGHLYALRQDRFEN